ncbi:MAG: hypothetical protein JW774_08610 [Candidatus Aureabacteria bacterium]|nr:hypothetical protein [Candidatus Auribacterota bacterium]
MRPIEFLQSIDRQIAADQIQQNKTHDSKDVTGELTVRQMQEDAKVKDLTVNESDQKNKINPDEEKEKKEGRHSQPNKEKKDEIPENKELLTPDPEKGQNLDIIV